jgi:hypothetical protein
LQPLADLDETFGCLSGVPDDWITGDFADHEQPPGRLGISQDQQVLLADARPGNEVFADPLQISACTTGDIALAQRFLRAVYERDCGCVYASAHSGGSAHLEKMSQKPKASDISCCADPSLDSRLSRFTVQRYHGLHCFSEYLACGLMPVVQQTQTDGFGQRQRQAGCSGVITKQLLAGDRAGHSESVFRLWVIHRMATDQGAPCLLRHGLTTAQHLGEQVQRKDLPRPPHQVDGHRRRSSHRVDVRQRVSCSNASPVVGVVNHGGEEVSGGKHSEVIVEAHRSGVITAVDPYQNVVVDLVGQCSENTLELPWRDLAGTPSTVGVGRQPGGCGRCR